MLVGMQSHGKSSLLEYLSHITLPTGKYTITLKLCLRNAKDGKEFARIKL